MIISQHMLERLENRWAGKLSVQSILQVVQYCQDTFGFSVGENAIKAKKYSSRKTIVGSDGSVTKGDILVIIVSVHRPGHEGKLVTVQLRDSKQPPATRWAKVIDLTQ